MTYAPHPTASGNWTYSGLPIQAEVETHKMVVEICQRHLPKGGRILDVAAGHGALSKSLLDCGFSVSCTSWNGKVDLPISTYLVDLDKPFDCAIVGEQHYGMASAIEIIEHVENPAQFLRSLAGVVEHGGYLLLSTPNVESAQARIEWLLNGFPYSFSPEEIYGNRHISLMWRQGIEAMLSMAGFDIVERHFVGRYRFSGRLQKLLRQPCYWFIESVFRGDTRGTSRLYLAKRSERVPRVLGAEDVA